MSEQTQERKVPPADYGDWVCFWCKEDLYDASEESGYTGDGPDLASGIWFGDEWIGGDFGCDAHPISDPELGVGPHETLAMVRDIVHRESDVIDRRMVALTELVTTDHGMEWALEAYDSGTRSETPDAPVELCLRADGAGLEIVDGHHRVAHAIRQGETAVRCVIYGYFDDEPYERPFHDFTVYGSAD